MTIPFFGELPQAQNTTRRNTSGGIPAFGELPESNVAGSVLGINYSKDEEERYLEEARVIGNRIKNIPKLIGAIADFSQGRMIDPTIMNAIIQGQKNSIEGMKIVKHDLVNMFSQADLKTTLKGLLDGTIDRVKNKKMETFTALGDIPGALIETLVGDTFAAVTGVGMSGDEIKALTPLEYAQSTKMFLGNAAAAAVAPAVSKMVEGTFALGGRAALGGKALTQSNIANATLAQQSALGVVEPVLGKLGRAVVDDVTAGAISGMTQGVIANANTPEAYSAAATGLLFAPIGILTGWYRGSKGTGTLENAITQARDISLLRQWQEIGDANIESIAKKVENLLSSDDIRQALLKGNYTTEQKLAIRELELYEKYKWDMIGREFPEDAWSVQPEDIASTRFDRIEFDEWKKQKGIKEEPFEDFSEPPITGTTINDLWQDFKTRLNEQESFASSLVRYAEEKKLTPHLNEMLEKFATKFVEENVDSSEIAHLNKLIEDNRKEMSGKFENGENIIDAAVEHGFFVTNEFGKLKIRDIESGEAVGVANTTAEAIAIMRETGKPANPVKMDAGANFNGGGIPTPPVVPGIGPHPADDFEPVTNNWQKRVTSWDVGKLKNLSSMNAFIEAIDLHFGTDLKNQVFEAIEHSHRATSLAINNNLKSGRVQLIDAMARRMTNEQLEQVGMALEAQSFDEIMAPNGYSQGFTVSPEAAQIAKFAVDNNIDLNKVLYFRRAQSAIRYYHTNRIEKNAHEQMQLNKQVGLSTAEASQIYDDAVAAVDQDANFLADMQKLFTSFTPDQNFIKTAEMFDNLYKSPDGSANSAAAVRLKLALEHPATHGLTQAEYSLRYLNSQQKVLLEKIQEAYKYFGQDPTNGFGIPDARMINRYMNHYRQFGDILDTYVIGDFERGIMDGAMRQFVSAMIRTGEVANYSMNPILNLTAYIRGGVKSKIIYRTLEDVLNRTDSAAAKQLAKVNDSVVRTMVERRLNDYQRDVTGQYSIGDTETMHMHAKMLSNLELDENGRRMTTQEILAEMNRPEFADTLLNLSTAGLIGGRPSMGLRDTWDMAQKFYIKFGAKRLYQLMRTKVSPQAREFLIQTSEITKPEPVDIYNVTHTQGPLGAETRLTKNIADLGFRMSLQLHFYMRNQAAVYTHSMQHVGKVLNQLATKKITQEVAYKAVDLNKYDVATQRMFNAYVKDGANESAARLLARQDVRELVGTFTRGNQSPLLNTKTGKLWGQLGSWGMTNRSVLQNLLTRGTKQDIATANIRYATTIAATGLVGRAMGVNLGRWMLLPTSVIFTGGPIVEMLQAAGSAAASEMGGSGQQTHFTRNTMSRSLEQFIPFSMLAKDVKKATELQTQGQGFGPVRTAAQATGVSANTQPFSLMGMEMDTHRTFLDYVIGNYPVKWEK